MVFQKMRRSIRPMMWAILIAFAVSIPLMYARSALQKGGEKPLAEVNGVPISYLSFAQSYGSAYERYYQLSGGKITPEIEKYLRLQVLSELVISELLWQEAKKADIQVSEEEIVTQIKSIMENFPSREAFMRVLEMRKISYPEFKKSVARQLAINELVQRIKDSAGVTEEEVKTYWMMENEKIEVEYILIKPEQYQKEVKVTQEDIEKYYETHTAEFRVPEKVKVNYIRLAAQDFQDEVKISPSTIRDYYQNRLAEYQIPERRKASHILIEFSSDATEEEKGKARGEIEKIQSKLRDGADFATLARQYSQDSVSVEKGGDLGFFSYKEMVPSFSEAVFALKDVGQVTEIIESPFGYHLAKLTGIKLAHTKTFEEVKDEIEKILVGEKSDVLAQEEARRVKNELEQGKVSFQEYGKEHPQRQGTSPLFAIDETIKEIGWTPEFNQIAFSLKEGEMSRVLKTFQGYFILGLEEKKPSYIPNLAEAQEKVEDTLITQRAQKLAQQKAKSIKLEAEKGLSFSSLAQEQNLEYEHLKYFNRKGWIEGIWGEDREEFIGLSFSLPVGKIGEPLLLTNGYYLINLKGREVPWEEFPKQKEKFKEDLLSQKKNLYLQAWLAKIREKAKIVDNSSLFFPP
jgi:peptidyl-prolyl cis-trans isomerase D